MASERRVIPSGEIAAQVGGPGPERVALAPHPPPDREGRTSGTSSQRQFDAFSAAASTRAIELRRRSYTDICRRVPARAASAPTVAFRVESPHGLVGSSQPRARRGDRALPPQATLSMQRQVGSQQDAGARRLEDHAERARLGT